MKKISLLTLAVVLGSAVFAQDAQPTLRTPMEKKVRFGIDAGVNLARFNVNNDEFANPSLAPDATRKTSFHAGFLVNIPLGGNFHLEPQVAYSAQGSKINQRSATGTGTTSTNYEEDLHYIIVAPAKFQYMVPGGFFVEAGPQVGFLIRADQEGPAPYNTDVKNMRKKTDVSVAAGLGYMTRVGLGVHARYVYGLSNVYNADDAPANPGEVQNRIIQVGLMYHFGAHK